MQILIIYASTHGSTAEVAHFIGDVLRDAGHTVTVNDVAVADPTDSYDAYVIGSAIHSGQWLPETYAFIRRFEPWLKGKPVFAWASCIRVLEPKGYDWVLNNYLPPWLLESLDVQDVTAFAGKLAWEHVSYDEKWTLALRYDGPHPPQHFDGDFRDWDAIRDWGRHIVKQLALIEADTA